MGRCGQALRPQVRDVPNPNPPNHENLTRGTLAFRPQCPFEPGKPTGAYHTGTNRSQTTPIRHLASWLPWSVAAYGSAALILLALLYRAARRRHMVRTSVAPTRGHRNNVQTKRLSERKSMQDARRAFDPASLSSAQDAHTRYLGSFCSLQRRAHTQPGRGGLWSRGGGGGKNARLPLETHGTTARPGAAGGRHPWSFHGT